MIYEVERSARDTSIGASAMTPTPEARRKTPRAHVNGLIPPSRILGGPRSIPGPSPWCKVSAMGTKTAVSTGPRRSTRSAGAPIRPTRSDPAARTIVFRDDPGALRRGGAPGSGPRPSGTAHTTPWPPGDFIGRDGRGVPKFRSRRLRISSRDVEVPAARLSRRGLRSSLGRGPAPLPRMPELLFDRLLERRQALAAIPREARVPHQEHQDQAAFKSIVMVVAEAAPWPKLPPPVAQPRPWLSLSALPVCLRVISATAASEMYRLPGRCPG